MSERSEFRAIQGAADLDQWATAYAAWTRVIMSRVGPLLAALLEHGPGGDPVLEELVATIDLERRTGNESSLRRLVTSGAARRRVVDAVWTLTAPEVYHRLVIRCGWSERAYEAWLSRQLRAAAG